ncbi:MAG: hypothetical protein GX539_10820 [Candidatus Cloacimonetes bacterium]|jgi:hypothetical protein|nr:hypothetical protein [Candidatus Cloacimonadota bacterium]
MSGVPRDIPAPLARRIASFLESAGREPIDGSRSQDPISGATPDALAAAGLAALRRALEADSREEAAADLLAADALLTHACADAATSGLPGALAPGQFAALLEER